MSKRAQFTAELEVHQLKGDDVYKDVIRIKNESRGDLAEGRVHKFCTKHGCGYFVLRGNEACDGVGQILMDGITRDKLHICRDTKYRFQITEATFWGELRWAWSAVDPAYRVSAKLGVLSFLLGILALMPMAWDFLKLIAPIEQFISSSLQGP